MTARSPDGLRIGPSGEGPKTFVYPNYGDLNKGSSYGQLGRAVLTYLGASLENRQPSRSFASAPGAPLLRTCAPTDMLHP